MLPSLLLLSVILTLEPVEEEEPHLSTYHPGTVQVTKELQAEGLR
jgi:hypothetical protein